MIKSAHGSSVESIYCNVARSLVVGNLLGQTQVERPGLSILIKNNESAPEDCPLRLPKNTRKIEDFVACVACRQSVVTDNAGNYEY